jgi:hypothetical protein
MILVTKCWENYCVADDGEVDLEEDGFHFEDQPLTFRELIWMMEDDGFKWSSCFPAEGRTSEHLTSGEIMDVNTGVWESNSLHYSQKNLPRSAKYWRWAFKAKGLIKGDQK